ncbi:MAG: tRNA lysidine(34) synthetase TilS [Burkholderiales bacterium]
MRQPASATDLSDHVLNVLRACTQPGANLCVGLSGGCDSVALLHLLASQRAVLGREVSALHVNHQISPHAGAWAEFCIQLCAGLAIPLRVERVVVARDSGKGLEAAAREARYEVFNSVDADAVLLAHHRDDQAETILLQALRGAGLKGISGMPRVRRKRENEQPDFVRPLLDVRRDWLVEYAKLHRLEWVEDESNVDTRYARNFLRHDVLPRIATLAPHYRDSLSRLASHAAEAQQLLDELAQIDLPASLNSDGLRIDVLCALSPLRTKNLLRHYFAEQGFAMPNATQLNEILEQLLSHRADSDTMVRWGNMVLRCYRGTVRFDPLPGPKVAPIHQVWNGEDKVELGQNRGWLNFESCVGVGLAREKLSLGKVTIRSRKGGERFQPQSNRPRRTLKKLLQEAGVPAWRRAGLPLVFCGDVLVWVAEIGLEYSFASGSGEPGLRITWHRSGAASISASPASAK